MGAARPARAPRRARVPGHALAQAHEAFDGAGRIANATLQQRFESTIECFLDLVEAAKHYRPLKKQWVEYLGEHPNAAIDRVEHTEIDTVGGR